MLHRLLSGADEQHALKCKLQTSADALRVAVDKVKALEEDLKIEREWRERLQENSISKKEEENEALQRVQQVPINCSR